MCLTCGCLNPTDDHGDQRNITITDMQKAADVQDISLLQAFKNFVKTLPVVIKNWKTYSLSSPVRKK